MDYTLVIDQGNTSSKVTLFENDKAIETLRFGVLSVEELCPIFEKYELRGVIYSSVVKLDVRLVESLRYMTDSPVLVMTHETLLPINVIYKTPQTLGLDRVAAAVAAASLYPNEAVLVVDAGTALTIDIVDECSRFVGGNISPGLSIRFKSLCEFTGALPLVEYGSSDVIPKFGYDTMTAIRSGVVNGVVAEIISSFEKAAEEYNCKRIVLTGGDSEYLISKLGDISIAIERRPNLVAEGLNRILLYNENN